MAAGHFWKETRFVKEHARRDKKSVFHGTWKVPLWERGRLHAKEMSACKTNVLKRPEIGQPSARALGKEKCKRLFKIQSVLEIYAKYVLRNSWYRVIRTRCVTVRTFNLQIVWIVTCFFSARISYSRTTARCCTQFCAISFERESRPWWYDVCVLRKECN